MCLFAVEVRKGGGFGERGGGIEETREFSWCFAPVSVAFFACFVDRMVSWLSLFLSTRRDTAAHVVVFTARSVVRFFIFVLLVFYSPACSLFWRNVAYLGAAGGGTCLLWWCLCVIIKKGQECVEFGGVFSGVEGGGGGSFWPPPHFYRYVLWCTLWLRQ